MSEIIYILLSVGMLVCCFKGPRFGIAALAFVLPLSRRLPSIPIPLLNAQNLAVLVGLAVLLARTRYRGKTGGVRFAVPMLAFIGFVTLAFANTMIFYQPVRYFAMWDPYAIVIVYKSLLTSFLIYAIGCMVARTREDIETVFKGLMLGAAAEAGFICLEVVMKGPARASGHLLEGNNAGAYLAGSLAAGLALVVVMKWRNPMWLLGAGSALASGIALIFTQSRGNWVSGILAASSVGLVRNRKLLAVIVLMVVTYQFWLPQSAMDRIDGSFTTAEKEPWRYRFREGTEEALGVSAFQARLIGAGDGEEDEANARLDGSSQIRLYVWSAALRMMADYPLGIGYGVFPFHIGYYSDIVKFRAAHNSYLQMACELGIPGLLLFLLFLCSTLVEAWLAYLKSADPLMKTVGLAALGAGVAMMVSAGFYNHFFVIEVNGQQWLLLGLATQARRVVGAAQAEVPVEKDEAVPLYRLVS